MQISKAHCYIRHISSLGAHSCLSLMAAPALPEAALLRHGVVVIPVFTLAEVAQHRHQLLDIELQQMPEFIYPMPKLVDGGFGALANPGSFHTPAVRALRKFIGVGTWALFQRVCLLEHPQDASTWRLEQLLDRVAVRPVGSATSAEDWHRDQAPTRNERVWRMGQFGPPDHRTRAGCAVLLVQPRNTSAAPRRCRLFARREEENRVQAATRARTRIEIPPGHMLVFFQNLVHEVHHRVMDYTSLRLFVGFRLTQDTRSLFERVLPGSKPQERRAFGGRIVRLAAVGVRRTGPAPTALGAVPSPILSKHPVHPPAAARRVGHGGAR